MQNRLLPLALAFSTLLSPCAFSMDSDGDGQYDSDEILAGTDINDVSDFSSPLNPDYGENGVVVYNPDFPHADFYELYPEAILEGPDGKLYLAGYLDGDEVSTFVTRFNDEWEFDVSYGTNGHFYAYQLGHYSDYVHDINVNNEGSLVLSLSGCEPVACNMVIDQNGTLDSTHYDGETEPGILSFGYSYHLTLLSSDGSQYLSGAISGSNGNVIVKKVVDEQLDTSFNDSVGSYTINLRGNQKSEYPAGLFEASDGGLIVVSRYTSGTDFTKLKSDGTLDTSFGTDGTILDAISQRIRAFAPYSDTQFVVVGSESNAYVYLFNEDGTLDTSFGSDGSVMITEYVEVGSIRDVLIQPDGSILVVYSGTDRDVSDTVMGVVKITPEGELDTTFDLDGHARIIAYGMDSFAAAGLLSDNTVVLTSETDSYDQAKLFFFANTNDQDRDGVEDSLDQYPNDPSRSVKSDDSGGALFYLLGLALILTRKAK